MRKTDSQLKEQIEDELRWAAHVRPHRIGLRVVDGAVAVTGRVDSLAEKAAAEAAIRRVHGVRRVTHHLEVCLRPEHRRTDAELKAALSIALTFNVCVPRTVTAHVRNGAVTLDGRASWNVERTAAERAVVSLTGVVSLRDCIELVAQPSPEQIRTQVLHALRRQAATDAGSIRIDACAGRITLSGHASSWQALHDAVRAAWATQGVTEVIDELAVARMF